MFFLDSLYFTSVSEQALFLIFTELEEGGAVCLLQSMSYSCTSNKGTVAFYSFSNLFNEGCNLPRYFISTTNMPINRKQLEIEQQVEIVRLSRMSQH